MCGWRRRFSLFRLEQRSDLKVLIDAGGLSWWNIVVATRDSQRRRQYEQDRELFHHNLLSRWTNEAVPIWLRGSMFQGQPRNQTPPPRLV